MNLVLNTIRLAIKREKMAAPAELQLHSDQGFQYTPQAYFDLTKQYGITPPMSRRGNPYDNTMAENFFPILKTECIYRHKSQYSYLEAFLYYPYRLVQFNSKALRGICFDPRRALPPQTSPAIFRFPQSWDSF